MNSIDPVRTIESIAINAWPAEEIVPLDGWRLRAAQGVTGRANSVWSSASGEQLSLEQKLEQVEKFYQERGLPPRYQITPASLPANLDDVLAERGYEYFSRTAVMTTELTEILSHTTPLRLNPEFEVEVSEEFDEDWFALYCQAEQVSFQTSSVRGAILQRIRPPVAFVSLCIEGVLAAIALGVVEKEWLGIFNVETHHDFRRRGAATALARTLALWAQTQNASHAYLQVVANNSPAIALYEKLGFTTLYHYHYRIKRS
ncbi:MAG: GNAT family N-acetyltransferase [Caldilineaceae bacterium]